MIEALQELVESQKKWEIAYYKMRQLPIDDQVNSLQEALSKGEDRTVFKYLLQSEPISTKNVDRHLSARMLSMLVQTATYPDEFEEEAFSLIVALVQSSPVFKEEILNCIERILNHAEKNCDYEVFERVKNLLTILNDRLAFDNFIEKCRSSNCIDVRAILD